MHLGNLFLIVQLHFSKLFLILKSGVNHTSRGSISTSTLPSIKLRKCSSKIITSILSFISGRLATKSNQIKQLIRNGRSASLQRSEERFSRNAETDLVCRLLLEKKKEVNAGHQFFTGTAGSNRRATDRGISHGETSIAGTAAVQFFLFGEPFHGARGPRRFGASRCCLAFGLQLFGPRAGGFKETPALHVGIEHLQGPAASVDLVVVGEIGQHFENAEQVLVPQAAEDLYIGDAALRAERSEPRPLVAALRGRLHGKAAESA